MNTAVAGLEANMVTKSSWKARLCRDRHWSSPGWAMKVMQFEPARW